MVLKAEQKQPCYLPFHQKKEPCWLLLDPGSLRTPVAVQCREAPKLRWVPVTRHELETRHEPPEVPLSPRGDSDIERPRRPACMGEGGMTQVEVQVLFGII